MSNNRPIKHTYNYLTEEGAFLTGPRARYRELRFALKVFVNFIKAFRTLHFIGPSITVFGSARFDEQNKHYQQAQAVGKSIANMGFTTITGGGPGIMEAANKGAYENGGYSVGCNIILPIEQEPNAYLHKWIDIPYFFLRKFLLIKYSYAFVVMPGGIGTLDELFESLTLIQTKMINNFPVVLFGKEYHKDLYEHIQMMVNQESIDEEDMNLLFLTDSIAEMEQHITKCAIQKYGLVQTTQKPKWWFGEKVHPKS